MPDFAVVVGISYEKGRTRPVGCVSGLGDCGSLKKKNPVRVDLNGILFLAAKLNGTRWPLCNG